VLSFVNVHESFDVCLATFQFDAAGNGDDPFRYSIGRGLKHGLSLEAAQLSCDEVRRLRNVTASYSQALLSIERVAEARLFTRKLDRWTEAHSCPETATDCLNVQRKLAAPLHTRRNERRLSRIV
jgi:hypothetical protein